MKYLLDTDHISFIERAVGAEYAAIRRNMARHAPTDVAFPVVSLHEQAVGAHALINAARRPRDILRGYEFLADALAAFAAAQVVPFDATAQAEFDRLRAAGVRIGTFDLRIAAIARSRNLIVCTRNTSDFGQVPGLVTEDRTK